MPGKNLLQINQKAPVKGAIEVNESLDAPAAPALPSIPAPLDLTLTSALERSAVTPMAVISAKWSAPHSENPQRYAVQWSTDPAFPAANTSGVDAAQQSAAIPGLRCATTYYVRVAALYRTIQSGWSDAVSIITVSDTTPPDPVTAFVATFNNDGGLAFKWTNPASDNFRDVDIRIYSDTAKTVLLAQAYRTGNSWVWSAAENRAATSGTPDASVYVEARARSWGNVLSSIASASATKARPASPTGATGIWDAVSGTCTFVCNPQPDATIYRWIIDAVPYDVRDTHFVYTLGQNRIDHGGAGDPSLAWSLTAIDALDQTSATPASGTATLPPPAMPTGLAKDFNGPDAIFTWDTQTHIVKFVLGIDGIAHDVSLSAQYTYLFALNLLEHGAPDPSLNYALHAVDALDQYSVPVTGTAINPPPDPPLSVDAQAGFTAIAFSAVVALQPLDLDTYIFKLYKNNVFQVAKEQPGRLYQYEPPTSGSWKAGVTVRDVFNQTSAEVLSPANDIDPLRLTDLRLNAAYRDSGGVSGSIFDVLKDGNLAGSGAGYTAGEYWIEFKRELLDRYKSITIDVSSAVYAMFATSIDGATWQWYAGTIGTDGRTMTSYGSGAEGSTANGNAYSNRFLLAVGVQRLDLPSILEARFVRFYFATSGSVSVREFYPRRLVQTDDLDAEVIRGMRISGHQFIADELAALSASLGAVTITGVCSIGTNGGIWQGAASGGGSFLAPVNGLKIWRDAANGVGRIATYSGGVVQVTFGTDGALRAGAGAVQLDATGMKTFDSGGNLQVSISATTGKITNVGGGITLGSDGLQFNTNNLLSSMIGWRDGDGNILGRLWMYQSVGNTYASTRAMLASGAIGTASNQVSAWGGQDATRSADLILNADGSNPAYSFAGIRINGNYVVQVVADKMIVNGAIMAQGGFIAPSTTSAVLFVSGGNAYLSGHNGRARIPMSFQGNTYTFEDTSGNPIAKIDNNGYYYVGGNKVVGARQAAIAAPSGGSTIDTQARTAINAIRALLQAHGLSN